MVKRSIILIIILLMICLAIGYQAYELNFIRLGIAAGVTDDNKQVTTPKPSQNINTLILAQLATLNLMGEPPKEVPKQAEPEKVLATSLNLILVGTIISTNQKKSSAIINDGKGTVKRYFIGDSLEGAVIDSVSEGVVVLQRSGKLETLAYPKQTGSAPQVAAAQAWPTPPANAESPPVLTPPDDGTPIKPAVLREQRLRVILERKKQQADLQQQQQQQ